MLNEQKNQNKNQIYLLIIDTMWIHCLIIYFVVSIVIFIINLFELLILIKKTKGKKEL
nr:MAG TPA: dystroglycan [Caudoviricetes sp.]